MLKERKELLEYESQRLHSLAANMYLSLAVGRNGDVNSPEYQQLRERMNDIDFQLNMVKQLLTEGKE